MPPRNDFLNQPAPENYVAGLGRGATGFTTRSDLGPAREGPSDEQIKEALAKRAAAIGTSAPTAYGVKEKKPDEEDDEDDERYQDPENEVGLFASGNYDQEDDEADRIYQDVDEKMDKRRKIRREAREQKERDDYEQNNPKIQQQFADLKRALGTITDEDWASIPEVGDLTGRNKRLKQDRDANRRFYAVPDSVLAGASSQQEFETSISTNGTQTNGDNADGTMTNFADIGAARDKVLQVRLDQAASGTETTSGTATTIDPKGYLTSLSQSELASGLAQVGDVKRVRGLLENTVKSNPKHAPGWMAIARLESHAGRIVAARSWIARGCEQCPKNEDVWIENIHLNEPHNAKIIAANAIKNNNTSVRLWIEAAKLENEPRAKKRVLRQALDHIPQSVTLWKEAVNLEDDPEDAKLLLHKATQIIPLSVDLWLALARLETPDQAQVVLNKARKAIPTSSEIWIAAGRLQEQLGEDSRVGTIMKRAVAALSKESAMLSREDWVAEAGKAEEEGAVVTAAAIIHETLGWQLEEDEDRKETWRNDAKSAIAHGRFATARAIYDLALERFPDSTTFWLDAANFEKEHGEKELLLDLLSRATDTCPTSHVLWMHRAREEWLAGDISRARKILADAFKANRGNEDIYLAAVKLESDAGYPQIGRQFLLKAREDAGTDRVWVKSVAFERTLREPASALDLVNEALGRYPRAPKLHMEKGQIYEYDFEKPAVMQAREAYSAGTRACPQSVPLWILAARLEARQGIIVKARSVLDKARLAVPKNAKLWVESVRIERKAGNLTAARQLMARALQEVPVPETGVLWAEDIWYLEPRQKRRPQALEAMKKLENDAVHLVTVARIFWSERKLDKAATWFEKAIVRDADIGDTWAWYVKFLKQHGKKEKLQEVIDQCVNREPRFGEVWPEIAKDPVNAGKGFGEILDLVQQRLEG